MKLHEYQAKRLLAPFGLPAPRGYAAQTPVEARDVAERLGGRVVVKAQIHAGGRGKGGGIRVADSVSEAESIAGDMLGMTLVTAQTGPSGRIVGRLLIEERLEIASELYLGLVVDRSLARPIMIVSPAGGIEIEQVAANTPDRIFRTTIDYERGLLLVEAQRLASGLGLEGSIAEKVARFMVDAYRAFKGVDATLIEINPLAITNEGGVIALDAKVDLDENALFRHRELIGLRDLSEEEELEIEASRYALNYIRLDGSIGCMVNGAGLAMATMDIIKLAGGAPANFLDVGGGANVDQIRNAFRILVADENVKAVLINIFGGILRCDVLAEGVVAAVTELKVTLPVVIRMEGTNVERGKSILTQSGLNFVTADTMGEAAGCVVSLAAG